MLKELDGVLSLGGPLPTCICSSGTPHLERIDRAIQDSNRE
jgi:hypothetical protein